MLSGLEVFTPEPVKDAAPVFRVAANPVVRVGRELFASSVEPAFLRPIAELLPHRFGIPVLVLLRDEIAALEEQDARAGRRQRMRHRPAAGAGADDDEVVGLGHCGK